MSKAEILQLLLQANASPIGVVVSTNNSERLRQKIYAVRREHPDLTNLKVSLSPAAPDTELFIVNHAELPDASE